MTTPEGATDFTEQEFGVIFGVCSGLSNREIAEQCRIGEDAVQRTMFSIHDKLGVSTRIELYVLIRAALNAELRRRSGRSI